MLFVQSPGSFCLPARQISSRVHGFPGQWLSVSSFCRLPLCPGQAIGGTVASVASVAFLAIGGQAESVVGKQIYCEYYNYITNYKSRPLHGLFLAPAKSSRI